LKVEFEEVTSIRKALAFEIEAEVVDQEIAARARHYARQVKLPGFRPGKVPQDVIKRRFKPQILEDVAETLVNRVVFEELDGRGLKPLAAPKVTELKIDEHAPLTFKAVFEVLPLVELPEYKGLSATVKAAQVADEAIDAEIDRLREEAARYEPIEGRPAQAGDYVLIDVAWRPAEGGEGGRDENALLEVGSADNHPELDAALTGLAVGETREARASYPEDHSARALAGRTFDYTLALKAIKRKVVPERDDEFAKDLGEYGSLAELRAAVRARLLAADERRADREARSALVAALVERASFEVPEALIERHMDARTEGAARSLALQGIDPTKVSLDWREYREAQREESLKTAKAEILIDEIARREGIEALDAELDAELARYAERLRKSKEAVRAQLEKDGELQTLRARIRESKVLDLLKANARLTFE